MAIASPTAETLSAFTESFLRLEAVAALYAEDHHRSLESSAKVLAQIAEIAGPEGTIELVVGPSTLAINRIEVPASCRTAAQLREEFDSLGVWALEIDARTQPRDLYAFARKLRLVTLRGSRSHHLQSVELRDLPPTVRIRFTVFGRRVASPATEVAGATAEAAVDSMQAAVGELLEEVCRPLEDESIDASTRRACRSWVEKSVHRFVERVTATSGPAGGGGSETQRALEDVLQLAGQALGHALQHYLSSLREAGDLQRLFKSIELATALTTDGESARLMVDVLQESAHEVAEEERIKDESAAGAAAGEPDCKLSIAQLRESLAELASGAEPMAGMDQDDRSETIAILLGLLAERESGAPADGLASDLGQALKGPLTRREREAAESGVRTLCASPDAARVDQTLPRVAQALESDQAAVWLGGALEAAEATGDDALEALWPHLANQLLLGLDPKCEGLASRLCAQVGRLREAPLASAFERLAKMPALAEGELARAAFLPPRPELFGLYEALLKSRSSRTAGPLLLEGFQRCPPTWPGAEVLKTFGRWDGAARNFLLALVRSGGLAEPPPALQSQAARILVERLEQCGRRELRDAWIPEALAALGKLGAGEAEPVLLRVLRQRRLWILPAWPRSCRAAAREALARIHDSPAPS